MLSKAKNVDDDRLLVSYRDEVDFRAIEEGALIGVVNAEYADELSPHSLRKILKQATTNSLDHKSAFPEIKLGRGATTSFVLPSGRRIVVRCCLRGGLIQLFLQRSFLRLPFLPVGCLRPIAEVLSLSDLLKVGVCVPVPVAGLVEQIAGGLVYRGYVITEMLSDVVNMLEVAVGAQNNLDQQKKLLQLCQRAGEEARKMLAAGIFHTDLHLGNVLVGQSDELFLIDFDKVRRFADSNLRSFQSRTAHRWFKSVKKHLGQSKFAADVQCQFQDALFGTNRHC